MLILGIDPGVAATGYGVIETEGGLKALEYGIIRTAAGTPQSERLREIHKQVEEIVRKHGPREIAMERLFFCRNTTTAISVGQAQGVILLAACVGGGAVFEYTPLEVKETITGYGRATKNQVQHRVKEILRLSDLPPDDTADALAVAMCHYHSRRLRMSIA